MDLMSQRSQRMSSNVTAVMPCSSCSGRVAVKPPAEAENRGRHAGVGQEVATLAGPPRHLEVDTHVTAAVGGDELPDELAPAPARMRIGNPERVQSGLQPVEMRLQAKRLAAVTRHDLVDAVAEEKAAIERRDSGGAGGYQGAVEQTGG